MRYNIFVSYPDSQAIIVQNLKGHIENLGVTMWVYATDRTLQADVWSEIEQKISESDLVLFVVSNETTTATGQQRELILANKSKILPLFISGTDPKLAPEGLGNINGDFLDAHNVKELALKIVKHQFPDLFQTRMAQPWGYPLPGEWLEVINLNANLSEYFILVINCIFEQLAQLDCLSAMRPGLMISSGLHLRMLRLHLIKMLIRS